MKNPSAIIGLIIVLIIIASGYYFYQETYQQTLEETKQQPNESVQPTSQPTTTPLASVLPIPTDWITFNSKKYGYTLSIPKDLKTETTTEGDRFIKLGPTQSLGTELYDGISITIRTKTLQTKTLEQHANEQQKLMNEEPTTQAITPVTKISYGQNQGFQFRKSSLGEADFIYLPKSETEYFEIINSTVEPTNREQTFQNIVKQIISSLKSK